MYMISDKYIQYTCNIQTHSKYTHIKCDMYLMSDWTIMFHVNGTLETFKHGSDV